MASSIFSILSVCILASLVSMDLAQRCYPQSQGELFTFAYPPNRDNDSVGLFIQPVSEFTTTVNVSVPLRDGLFYQIVLNPGDEHVTLALPSDLVEIDVHGISQNTVVVHSDQMISLIGYNMREFSIDTFTVSPVEHLSTEYFVTIYPGPMGLDSTIHISALSEPTVVDIMLTASVLFNGVTYSSGDVITHAMSPYETIQIETDTIQLTGTRIVSMQPVTVVVGSRCANVPQNVYSCDHLSEQILPFSRWGKTFTVSPFALRGEGDSPAQLSGIGYIYQIVAGRDNTVIDILDTDGQTTQITLDMSEHYLADVMTQDMRYISATQPIQVAVYAKTTPYYDRFHGDASLAMVPSHEQFIGNVDFAAAQLPGIFNLYVAVTADCDDIGKIMFNYASLDDTIARETHRINVTASDKSFCTRWFPATNTTHRMHGIMDDGTSVAFNAQVFGFGPDVSHSHYPGFNNEVLNCKDDNGDDIACSSLPLSPVECTVWSFPTTSPAVSNCAPGATLTGGDICTFSCPEGYEPDGPATATCEQGGYLSGCPRACINIDECTDARYEGLYCQGPGEVCEDSEGSFDCTCNTTGWVMVGDACQDIDECTDSDPCDPVNGVCTNTDGSYTCGCSSGWVLGETGITCDDVDECLASPCDPTNGVCSNTLGSYLCTCDAGWQLDSDLITCIDVNECLGDSGCVIGGCRNTQGGFVCDPSLPVDAAPVEVTADSGGGGGGGGVTDVTSNSNGGSNVGVIVGSVIGAIAALGILIGIVLCYCCCFAAAAVPERRREEEEEWDKEMLSYSLAANPLTNPGMGQASVAHNFGASRYAIGEHGVVFED